MVVMEGTLLQPPVLLLTSFETLAKQLVDLPKPLSLSVKWE